MQKTADITFQDARLFVSGHLDFANVMLVYEKSLIYLTTCPELYFDFSLLRSSDSSGLALIVEWIKFAKRHQKSIYITRLSQDLLSLAGVSGLDKLISNAPV